MGTVQHTTQRARWTCNRAGTDRQTAREGRETDPQTGREAGNEARIHRVEETDRRGNDQVVDEADRQERQTDRQTERAFFAVEGSDS